MTSLVVAIKQAAWVLAVALVLAFAAYGLRPLLMLPDNGGPARQGDALPEDRVPVIDFDSAVAHFHKGTAIFADARSDMAYQQGHIEGALHLDPHQFDTWSEQVFSLIDPDAVIITYCDGEHCSLGFALAEKLTWLGYDHVRYLKDGWSRWAAAQLPTGKGPS